MLRRRIGTARPLNLTCVQADSFSYRMAAKDGSMGFDFAGMFTKVIPKEVIELSLGDQRSVVVEFVADDQVVTVRETFDVESSHAAEQERQGWQAILNNFARYVEAKH